MRNLYDTRTIHALDRYHFYRAAAANERAPVEVHGRTPGQILAIRHIADVGEFEIEALVWACDELIVARRTERCIRAADPECYRLFLNIEGGVRMTQADQAVEYKARDIGLYDLSYPYQTRHPFGGRTSARVVMVTFPRELVPVAAEKVRPLLGTVFPRDQLGRGLLAQLLVELADGELPAAEYPSLATALRECAVSLVRTRVGLSTGLDPQAERLIQLTRIRAAVRRRLDRAELDPAAIASAVGVSCRSLHKIISGTGTTPMALVKELRMAESRRCLEDPSMVARPVGDIAAAVGYPRLDQFAHDVRQAFGISASELRRRAGAERHRVR